jgi:hypothetical protein
MKTVTLTQTLMSIGLALSLLSCAGENGFKAAQNGGNGPGTENRLIPNVDSNLINPDMEDYWSNYPGASVSFTPDSLTTFNEYVATHPLNNPKNFRLYLDLYNVGNQRWGGYVVIGYRDNGQIFSGNFSTFNPNGTTHNRVSYKDWYKNLPNEEFNQWFYFQGKKVFHGFFQDAYGAIIIVIDGGIDLGDGQSMTDLTGSVWFKNFKLAPAPQFMGNDGEQCWFLLPPSPYECGTFKDSSGRVNTTSSLYPSNGYKRLGTFSGLKLEKAFRN